MVVKKSVNYFTALATLKHTNYFNMRVLLYRYAEGSFRIWIFSAVEGDRDFGRLVHTSDLDSWEALKGFTCLRGPRGEVYSIVATTGGAGLAVMRLNLDTFE